MQNVATIIENTLIPHTAFATATSQLEQCFRYAESALEPICLPIVGETRTGKSRSLETFKMAHPRTRTPEGVHIPVFSVKTPAKPTVKGLAEALLREMGDTKFGSGTEIVKTNRLQNLMAACGTRVVIVDEFQHFVDKGSSKIAYHVADWLKTLVDESRVAIVVAGLPSCLDVLRANEQLDGRFMAPVALPRFNWLHADHREEFLGILDAFHEQIAHHFDTPDFCSNEMAFRFHCASGGLIGYLAKILRFAIWQAIDEQRKSISLENLKTAVERSVNYDFASNGSYNPFSREFSVQPTVELLDLFSKIGRRVEGAVSNRAKGRQKKLNLEEVI